MNNLVVKNIGFKYQNLNNIHKIFIMVILICLICLIKIDIVHAQLKVDGITSAKDFEECGPYNGCIDVAGYRYTIVKDYQKFESHISYNTVSSSWEDSTYHSFSKSQYNNMKNSIISGGNYFRTILLNTHMSEDEFFDNNYSILVEPIFILYYFNSRNKSCDNRAGCYDHRRANKKTGNANDIGMFIYNNYDLLGGMRSVTYNIPCMAYIGYPNDDSYDPVCSVVPTREYLDTKSNSEKKELYKKYMSVSSSNSRYGSTVIYSDKINRTSYNVRIVKTDEDGYKINSNVTFDLYRGNCYQGTNQRFTFNGSTNLKLYKGNYCLVEVNAPDGYIKSSNRHFYVSGNNTITITNKRQTGSLTIEKQDIDTKDRINGAIFAIYNGYGCTGSIYKNNITVNGIRTISNIPTGAYSIKEITPPNNYEISGDSCINTYINYNRTSGEIFKDKYTNNITINKVDEKGNLIASEARFKICSDYSCNNVLDTLITKSGKVTSKRYPVGTYYIKEEQAPLGYEQERDVTSVRITHNPNSVTIKNTNKCIIEFNKLQNKNDMVSRLNLYNDLKAKYKFDYKNLLNLANQTAESACTTKNINYEAEKGCLSASINTTDTSFSQDNLSNFTDVINGAYCSVTFRLVNNLNNLNKYEFTSKYNFNNSIGGKKFKAGLMVLNRESPEIAKGILTNTCYAFNTTNKNDANSTVNYNDYVGELKFNSDKLEIDVNNIKQIVVDEEVNTNQNYVKVTKEIEATYNLKPVFASNGNGIILNKECNNCKFLGYGFASSLNQSTKDDIGVPFSIKFNKLIYKSIETKNQCIYSVENDIIDKPDPKDERLNIEFRLIDIKNPFPGRSGSGRKVGTNWCDGDNCEVKNNSIIKKYIMDANNSYNKNNISKPLYSILLNSDTIKDIREYNTEHSYDDYNLECNANESKCKSNFLKDILEIS